MSFTDEQLELFKKHMKFPCNAWESEHSKDMLALLSRLESAERYCQTNEYRDRIAWKVSKGELTGIIRSRSSKGGAGK